MGMRLDWEWDWSTVATNHRPLPQHLQGTMLNKSTCTGSLIPRPKTGGDEGLGMRLPAACSLVSQSLNTVVKVWDWWLVLLVLFQSTSFPGLFDQKSSVGGLRMRLIEAFLPAWVKEKQRTGLAIYTHGNETKYSDNMVPFSSLHSPFLSLHGGLPPQLDGVGLSISYVKVSHFERWGEHGTLKRTPSCDSLVQVERCT